VSPSPLGLGSGEGAVPPPQKFFSILELKIATFGAFWVLFFYSSVAGFTRKKTVLLGLENLLLHALQVRREQKAEHAFWELYKAFANIEFRSFI